LRKDFDLTIEFRLSEMTTVKPWQTISVEKPFHVAVLAAAKPGEVIRESFH
jgi:hypothetical protein